LNSEIEKLRKALHSGSEQLDFLRREMTRFRKVKILA